MAERFKERWMRWDNRANFFWAKLWKIARIIIATFLVLLVPGLIIGYGTIDVHNDLDRSGWIRHSAVTTVSVSGDWWVGEFKDCYGVLEKNGTQGSLDCGAKTEGTTHTVLVQYWGRLAYPERVSEFEAYKTYQWQPAVAWKCQRNSESLTCWAQ